MCSLAVASPPIVLHVPVTRQTHVDKTFQIWEMYPGGVALAQNHIVSRAPMHTSISFTYERAILGVSF